MCGLIDNPLSSADATRAQHRAATAISGRHQPRMPAIKVVFVCMRMPLRQYALLRRQEHLVMADLGTTVCRLSVACTVANESSDRTSIGYKLLFGHSMSKACRSPRAACCDFRFRQAVFPCGFCRHCNRWISHRHTAFRVARSLIAPKTCL